jgi:hypothetical protein
MSVMMQDILDKCNNLRTRISHTEYPQSWERIYSKAGGERVVMPRDI